MVAQTVVRGPRRAALDEGYSLLARYVLGRNEEGEVMDMVVPILQQRVEDPSGPAWLVYVILPEECTSEHLPQPLGGRVEVLEAPETTIATLRFAFYASERKLARKEQELRKTLAARGTAVVGEPIYAFYSSPFIPPFMRRNEVWLEVAGGEESGA